MGTGNIFSKKKKKFRMLLNILYIINMLLLILYIIYFKYVIIYVSISGEY